MILVVEFAWMSPVDTPQLFDFEDVWKDNVGMAAIVPINRQRRAAHATNEPNEDPHALLISS